MVLFTESPFPLTFDLPIGVVGTPAGANDPVVLQLGDGTQVTVFDKFCASSRTCGRTPSGTSRPATTS